MSKKLPRTSDNWPSPPENDPMGPTREISRHHHRGSNTPGMQDTPPGGSTPYTRSSRRPVNPYPPDTTVEEDSEDDCYPSSKCKQCKTWQQRNQELEEDLRATRKERERLEQLIEKLRKDVLNSESGIAMLTKEREKLRVEVKRLKERQLANDTDPQPEYYSGGDSKRMKQMEDEMYALKEQKHSLKTKCEELQKANWLLKDENQKLRVRLLDEGEKTRKPGDGGSEAASARSSYASEGAFHRGVPGRHSANRLSGRDSSHGFAREAGMRRVPSDNQVQGSDEPVREQDYPSASKSHKSAPSEGSEYFPVPPLLNLQSSVPEEQSDVFTVLGDTVSRSTLPEGQSSEQQIALIYTLQNCHSVQELIHCLLGCQGSQLLDDQHVNYKVENEHLKKKVEHLSSKNDTLSSSFESSKQMAAQMYHHSNKVEANNTRLRHTLVLCQQAFDVSDLLSEMKDVRAHDPRNPAHASSGFSMNEYGSLESTTLRGSDNQKQTLATRARATLQCLEGMPEIQVYLPTTLGGHTWVGNTLSQTTGTSGLSSISGSVEMDSDMERLRMYAQALRSNIHHLLSTLTPIDGLKGLETVKIPDKVRDCEQGDGSAHILDLEEAANAEELCKAREERAEMKSQLYMMEHEKRRMELDVCHASLLVKQYERMIEELRTQLSEERGKRRREREKGRSRKDNPVYPGDSDMALDLQESKDREKNLGKRYSDLFMFILNHIRFSHENVEQLMAFVKELRRANSALVEAFEKCKKHHEAEKKRMKQECLQIYVINWLFLCSNRQTICVSF
ncbi:hypothetical protein EMCRGX_G029925 [Ephydatia muelleri]